MKRIVFEHPLFPIHSQSTRAKIMFKLHMHDELGRDEESFIAGWLYGHMYGRDDHLWDKIANYFRVEEVEQ